MRYQNLTSPVFYFGSERLEHRITRIRAAWERTEQICDNCATLAPVNHGSRNTFTNQGFDACLP
jgi:hypothetical protein